MTATEDVKNMIEVHEHLYKVIEQIAPSLKGKRILDAGAGWQDKTEYRNIVGSIFWLPELFEEHDYVTMDIRPECGCEVTGDIEELDKFFDTGSFDVVMNFEVLEHVLNPGLVLTGFRRVLKTDGFLFISAPFYQGHHTPRDLWRWTEDGLKFLLLATGFQVVKMVPIGGEVGKEWSWMAIARKVDDVGRAAIASDLASFEAL